MAVRSGTFSFDVNAGTNPGDASQRLTFSTNDMAGAVYRVFNSSDRASANDARLRVTNERAGGSYNAAPEVLFPTMSIDVGVGTTDDVNNHPAGLRVVNGTMPTDDVRIRGSFDLVRDKLGWVNDRPRRSGRFNFPPRVPNNFLPVMLVDLQKAAAFVAIYRFHNTGDKAFELFVAADQNDMGAARELTLTLDSHEAVDLYVPEAGNSRRVFVNRIVNGDPISGVFEMIG